jgi:hypothetical protein
MAILACARQRAKSPGLKFTLRALVFAFAAYAVMFSLAKSADAYRLTREVKPEEPVDLRSLARAHRDTVIPLGLDRDFIERARLVTVLCQAIAAEEGVRLYDPADAFPLPETIAADLMAYVDRVLDCEDANARPMANLVAEALDGHPAGMEYLYLRSKTFRSNRELPTRV